MVDTPGLREVGMWALAPTALDVVLPRAAPLPRRVPLRRLHARVEPDCAVRAAVEAGEVSVARYESYLKLREELEDEQ